MLIFQLVRECWQGTASHCLPLHYPLPLIHFPIDPLYLHTSPTIPPTALRAAPALLQIPSTLSRFPVGHSGHSAAPTPWPRSARYCGPTASTYLTKMIHHSSIYGWLSAEISTLKMNLVYIKSVFKIWMKQNRYHITQVRDLPSGLKKII